MKSYVAGFMFDHLYTKVALVLKKKPASMKFKWNAIGGKIEANETAEDAIVREFQEETGVFQKEWDLFCKLVDVDKEWEVFFFTCRSSQIDQVRTNENELIEIHTIEDLRAPQSHVFMMPNLPWLIPLAIFHCKVDGFAEVYPLKDGVR